MMEEQNRHLHRCQNCGMVWGHGNMMKGDVEAHKCPRCGKAEWRGFSGGQEAQPAKTIAVVQANYRSYLQALLTVTIVVMVSIVLGEFLAGWLLPRD